MTEYIRYAIILIVIIINKAIMERKTAQKRIILEVVRESTDHPSAETIYERARDILPKLSLGTVYRNLAKLAEDGTIATLSADETRFDKTVSMHGHFVCRSCGEVYDVFDGADDLEKCLEGKGFRTESSSIVFRGLCPECNKKLNQNEGDN